MQRSKISKQCPSKQPHLAFNRQLLFSPPRSMRVRRKKEAKPVVQTLGLLLNFGTHPLSWFTAYEYFHSRHFRFRTSHSLSSFFATNPRYIKNCARSLSPFQNPKWIAPFGNGSFPPVAAQSWPEMLSEWPGHMCIDGHQDGKRIELGVLFLFNGAVGNGRYLFFCPSVSVHQLEEREKSFFWIECSWFSYEARPSYMFTPWKGWVGW